MRPPRLRDNPVPSLLPPRAFAERVAAAPDPALAVALEQAMTVGRAYRQEGLSIGQLALRLGLPEYRLRQLINQELGYRNFAAFPELLWDCRRQDGARRPRPGRGGDPDHRAQCWLQLARSFQSRLQGRGRHDPSEFGRLPAPSTVPVRRFPEPGSGENLTLVTRFRGRLSTQKNVPRPGSPRRPASAPAGAPRNGLLLRIGERGGLPQRIQDTGRQRPRRRAAKPQ